MSRLHRLLDFALLAVILAAPAACSEDDGPVTAGNNTGNNANNGEDAGNNANNAPNNGTDNNPGNNNPSNNNPSNNNPSNNGTGNNTPGNNGTDNNSPGNNNTPRCEDTAPPRCDGEDAVIRCIGEEEVSTPCGDTARCADGACVELTPTCEPGAARCDAEGRRERCSADGASWEPDPCAGQEVCTAEGTCTLPRACEPGTTTCSDDGLRLTCAEDGSSFGDPQPCEEAMICAEGQCLDRCEQAATGIGAERSNLGCEFWALLLEGAPIAAPALGILNPQDHPVRFTIRDFYHTPDDVVPQAGSSGTTVYTEILDASGALVLRPEGLLEDLEIPPGGSAIALLRRKRPLGLDTALRRGLTNTWQLVTTAPVAAFQFGGYCCAGANNADATLLLPALPDALEHVAVAPSNGYVTLVGQQTNTQLLASLTSRDLRNPTLEATPDPSGELYVRLGPYDQLHLQPNRDNQPDAVDLSGSNLLTDLPVSVFGGHVELKYPFGAATGDHVEHQIPPLGTWASGVVIAPPPWRSSDLAASDERLYVKLVAGDAPTAITFDPPLGTVADSGPASTSGVQDCRDLLTDGAVRLGARGVCEVGVRGAFAALGTAPFAAATFTTSATTVVDPFTDSILGDPAFVIWPGIEQHLAQTRFLVPPAWPVVHLLVVAPEDAALLLDGEAVAEPGVPVGQSGFAAWTLPVEAGAHQLRATGGARFGAVVMGFGPYAAWGYAAGMGLQSNAER